MRKGFYINKDTQNKGRLSYKQLQHFEAIFFFSWGLSNIHTICRVPQEVSLAILITANTKVS